MTAKEYEKARISHELKGGVEVKGWKAAVEMHRKLGGKRGYDEGVETPDPFPSTDRHLSIFAVEWDKAPLPEQGRIK